MAALRCASGYERLVVFNDASSGASGVIGVHSTILGPAMGGLRLHRYPGIEAAAEDALRLARVMTFKNAAAGLALGGGKAVLLDDGEWTNPERRAARMRAVGRVIRDLGGLYITAEDVGTTPSDMAQIAQETRWVAGKPVGAGGRGDPSPLTASTVLSAIRAAVESRLGHDALRGVRVGVQGVGHVGEQLTELLVRDGALVTVTDADLACAGRVGERLGVDVVEPHGFVERSFDVLAPCALGEVIDRATVPRLRCAVIAGAANNPLADDDVARELANAGVLYVPDFLANCGGIIHVGAEPLGLSEAEVGGLLDAARGRIVATLEEADRTGLTPSEVAVAHAQERLDAQQGLFPELLA